MGRAAGVSHGLQKGSGGDSTQAHLELHPKLGRLCLCSYSARHLVVEAFLQAHSGRHGHLCHPVTAPEAKARRELRPQQFGTSRLQHALAPHVLLVRLRPSAEAARQPRLADAPHSHLRQLRDSLLLGMGCLLLRSSLRLHVSGGAIMSCLA